jgi:hypothetical protein
LLQGKPSENWASPTVTEVAGATGTMMMRSTTKQNTDDDAIANLLFQTLVMLQVRVNPVSIKSGTYTLQAE